jgi:hypothetical protein
MNVPEQAGQVTASFVLLYRQLSRESHLKLQAWQVAYTRMLSQTVQLTALGCCAVDLAGNLAAQNAKIAMQFSHRLANPGKP